MYEKKQNATDMIKNVVRVYGICFAKEATEKEISDVLKEIKTMSEIGQGFMTCEALVRYMEAPEYVKYRMNGMEVGSDFIYDGRLIRRWSYSLYNSKSMDQ